jgi:hypothetical protein
VTPFTNISRWDIIAERLGFMLVFGDLVFIPFTFSIQVYISICWNSDIFELQISTCAVTEYTLLRASFLNLSQLYAFYHICRLM